MASAAETSRITIARHVFNRTLAVAISVPALCHPLEAQNVRPDTGHAVAGNHGRILGVYDDKSGAPIAGADVIDLLTGDHAVTSETGAASLWFVRGKGSLVAVRKIGYEPWQSIVDPTDTTPITVVLKQAVELPLVTTTARPNIAKDAGLRDGFDVRCQAANVTCVRENVIDAHPNSTIGDLLTRADGIIPAPGKIRMHAAGGGACIPAYFVDGYRWDIKAMGIPIGMPGGSPMGTTPFSPANVEKIEVYPANGVRPLRFSGDANCGVIAIWTK